MTDFLIGVVMCVPNTVHGTREKMLSKVWPTVV
jgi:hypothetical protein